MRAAGPRARFRQCRVTLRRAQARRQGQEPRPAHLDRHDALHPLHALRALHGGNRGHAGARRDGPRRGHGDRHLHREERRPRAVGQRHRPLPGRRAEFQAVPPPRALLGNDRARARLAARRRRHEPVGPCAARPPDARRAADQRGDQRDLDRGPRPLLVRRHLCAGPAARADDARGRPLAGGVVGGCARGGGDDAAGRGQGKRGRARRFPRGARLHERRRLSARPRRARTRLAQRRFATAPARFLGPGERSGVSGAWPRLARHRRPRGSPAGGLRRAHRGADRGAPRARGGARRLQGERRLDDGAGVSVPAAAADGRAACGPRRGNRRACRRPVE